MLQYLAESYMLQACSHRLTTQWERLSWLHFTRSLPTSNSETGFEAAMTLQWHQRMGKLEQTRHLSSTSLTRGLLQSNMLVTRSSCNCDLLYLLGSGTVVRKDPLHHHFGLSNPLPLVPLSRRNIFKIPSTWEGWKAKRADICAVLSSAFLTHTLVKQMDVPLMTITAPALIKSLRFGHVQPNEGLNLEIWSQNCSADIIGVVYSKWSFSWWLVTCD